MINFFLIFIIFLFQTIPEIKGLETYNKNHNNKQGMIFILLCKSNSNEIILNQIKQIQEKDKLFSVNLCPLESKTNIKKIIPLLHKKTHVILDINLLELDKANNFDKEYILYTISKAEKQYVLANTITTQIEKYPNINKLIQSIKEKVK